MKGVAVKTLFLIFVIGMIIFTTLIIFWHWFSAQITITSKLGCKLKVINYCERWYVNKNEPNDWNKVKPLDEDCQKIEGLEGFTKPDEAKCKEIIGVWYR
jgi:hypothetical protein